MVQTLVKYADENQNRILLYQGTAFKHKDIQIMNYSTYLEFE